MRMRRPRWVAPTPVRARDGMPRIQRRGLLLPSPGTLAPDGGLAELQDTAGNLTRVEGTECLVNVIKGELASNQLV